MLEHISVDQYYSELPPGFNWMAVLKDLAAGAKFTDADHRKLRMLAGCWPTCACGQLCRNLPRQGDGTPIDPILTLYGIDFFNFVEDMNWSHALSSFHNIEERTMKLLDL